jgi:hypothetical protein
MPIYPINHIDTSTKIKSAFYNRLYTHESPTIGLCINTCFGPKAMKKTPYCTKNKALKKKRPIMALWAHGLIDFVLGPP